MRVELMIPETDEDRIFITAGCARELMKIDMKTHTYHSFQAFPLGLIGANVSWENLDPILMSAKSIEISGDNAMGMGHGICVIDEGDNVFFFEHDEKAMEEFMKERSVGNES